MAAIRQNMELFSDVFSFFGRWLTLATSEKAVRAGFNTNPLSSSLRSTHKECA